MEKIKWGIVGPGNIAGKFAKAVKNVECAELTAVASRSKENGEKFAEKFNIANVFCGYEEMAKSNEIDAVYIATPHPFHKPCAELFLKAKKHVLCEKPICVNAFQAEKLKKCAKENEVFLMEAMWTRFLPAVNEAREIAGSGEIGEILGIKADFCYALGEGEDPKLLRNDMAGGSLLDVGVYTLHFASMFMGNKPESIYSVAQIENGIDKHINILMKYKNGAVASLSSAINLYKSETAYVYGTKGYIYLPHFYGANEIYVYTDKEKHIKKPCIGDGFEEEIYEACRCIEEGKTESDILPPVESIEILKQMDYIRKQNGLFYPLEGENI